MSGLVLALVLAAVWLAPLGGELARPVQVVLGVAGCAVITVYAWTTRITPAHLGLQAKNLLAATVVFGLATAVLGVTAVVANDGEPLAPFPIGELPSYFLWALFQQYVAVGGFWVPLRRASGLETTYASFGRELPLAGAAALVFAVAHAPNVGLMVLVGLAEWLWLSLFARWRNLFSLSLAHAAAALVVAHHLVPSRWLPSMQVGLGYFGS